MPPVDFLMAEFGSRTPWRRCVRSHVGTDAYRGSARAGHRARFGDRAGGRASRSIEFPSGTHSPESHDRSRGEPQAARRRGPLRCGRGPAPASSITTAGGTSVLYKATGPRVVRSP
ncbi:hypothetical protein GCM10022205_51760 [Spinactinospora alkalitolerans]